MLRFPRSGGAGIDTDARIPRAPAHHHSRSNSHPYATTSRLPDVPQFTIIHSMVKKPITPDAQQLKQERVAKKQNYQQQLDAILTTVKRELGETQKKPSLLLHACCGPCSSYVIEYLAPYFDITIYYYNPNIFPPQEYERRLTELSFFLTDFDVSVFEKVTLVRAEYEPEAFYTATNVRHEPQLQREAERGERCRRCYELRMTKAYQYAVEHHFDWFTTTLSISPFKDEEKINTIGKQLEDRYRAAAATPVPRFLTSDFKKRGGFKRSLELSREYDLYRQDYCGCEYSLQNTRREQNKTTEGAICRTAK